MRPPTPLRPCIFTLVFLRGAGRNRWGGLHPFILAAPTGGCISPLRNGGAAPNGLAYFVRNDADAKASKRRSVGATVIVRLWLPEAGRFGGIQDPRVCFWIINLNIRPGSRSAIS